MFVSSLLALVVLTGDPLSATANPSVASGARIAECRVGFAGTYKVGHWTPVWIDVEDIETLTEPRLEITASDSDGVPATVSVDIGPAATQDGSAVTTVTAATLFGRMGSPLTVSLLSQGDVIERREIPSGPAAHKEWALNDLPAAAELLVALGKLPFGLEDAFAPRDATTAQPARRTVRLDRVSALPVEWFAYDGVDVLVLSVGDGILCRELAADTSRLAALRRWVALGGRLVILCDGNAAQRVLAEGQPLAALVPARVVGAVRLAQTGPLEHFAERSALIAEQGERIELDVPRLTDVVGRIEAYAGQQPTDLPLVIRGPLGLGEVAVAGVNLASGPLANWAGRTAFLQALLRPYVSRPAAGEAPQSLMTLGYNDLSGALRQRMGNSFAGLTTITFPAVASLALAYLLLLGPGDYWLVHRVLRRPAAAWVTFPLLVVLISASAYALTGWSKDTGGPRVNELRLVDIDVTTSVARGTYWGVLYSPDARRFDLGLSTPAGDTSPTTNDDTARSQTLLFNWGLAGDGIGGMDGRSVALGFMPSGYRYSSSLDRLAGVPLLTASTKSLLGRWTAPARPLVEAQLRDDDGLAIGSVTNRSGQTLRNARLLYGTWAIRLGTLTAGEQIEVGQHLNAIQVKTMVARSAGIATDRFSGETARSTFFSDRASAEELLNLMMFYGAAGGQAFAQLPSRYQSYCDLSRLLELGRAILVCEVAGPGRQLESSDSGEPLAAREREPMAVYRLVLPVEKE